MTEQPGGRYPAPDALALVQDFLNTNDIEGQRDELGSAGQLRDWLIRRGLLADGEVVGEDDLRRALALREAVRALALANNGVPVDAAAVETLNRVAGAARLAVRSDEHGRPRFEPADPGPVGALAHILVAVGAAAADGTWTRLKACRNDECHWVFYDSSRNRSGKWCSMAICGSRQSSRNYRRRRRQAQ